MDISHQGAQPEKGESTMGWSRDLNSVSAHLYAVAFILCFLAFRETVIPGAAIMNQLDRVSYDIRLLHPTVLELVARGTRQLAPWILAYHIIFQPLLILFGLGVPLLFVRAVSESPVRRSYRCLFG